MNKSYEMFESWLSYTKPVMPVIVINNVEDAEPLANALFEGGVKIAEITLRTSAGIEVIELLARKFPEMIVGAGTVVNLEQVQQVADAGGRFVVSPGFSNEIAELTEKLGLAYLPGVATATEIMMALNRGYRFLKFFPAAQAGGVAMLKAFSGPFSQIKFCPTGGISEADYKEYLALKNVLCVGGSWVATNKAIEDKDWTEVAHQASLL